MIVWEGGNNDTPFVRPDLHLVLVDPHRAGHELRYHPGETNLRMADVCIVNKVDTAPEGSVDAVLASIASVQPVGGQSSAPPRRSRSRAAATRSQASASSASRTGRR